MSKVISKFNWGDVVTLKGEMELFKIGFIYNSNEYRVISLDGERIYRAHEQELTLVVVNANRSAR